MRFVEKTGRTIDSAVTEALIELGAATDQVTIEVIQKGSKGFLGFGAKNAIVKVTVNEIKEDFTTSNDTHIQKKSTTPDLPIKKVKVVEEKPKQKVDSVIIEKTSLKTEEVVEKPVQKSINIEDAVKNAEEFLLKVLAEMKIEAKLEVKVTDKRINIDISGPKMGMVIGKRGETLDALQYLTNIIVNKGHDSYVKVMIDTENYRSRREETLRKVALKFAKKATETKKSIALEPMNPYDRRIIHSVLQNSRFVKTHSEGREPFRKVVITPFYPNKSNKINKVDKIDKIEKIDKTDKC